MRARVRGPEEDLALAAPVVSAESLPMGPVVVPEPIAEPIAEPMIAPVATTAPVAPAAPAAPAIRLGSEMSDAERAQLQDPNSAISQEQAAARAAIQSDAEAARASRTAARQEMINPGLMAAAPTIATGNPLATRPVAPEVAASPERGNIDPAPAGTGVPSSFDPKAPAGAGSRLPTVMVAGGAGKVPSKSVNDQEEVQVGAATQEQIGETDAATTQAAGAKQTLGELEINKDKATADLLTEDGGFYDIKEQHAREVPQKENERSKQTDEGAKDLDGLERDLRAVPEGHKKSFFASRNFGEALLNVFSAVALTLGGDANFAKGVIDQAVNEDIDAQKRKREVMGENLKNRRSLYDLMLNRFGDERTAEAATRSAALDEVMSRIDKFRAGITDEARLAKIDLLKGEVLAEENRQQAEFRKLYGDKIARTQAVSQAVPQRAQVATPAQKLTAERAVEQAYG